VRKKRAEKSKNTHKRAILNIVCYLIVPTVKKISTELVSYCDVAKKKINRIVIVTIFTPSEPFIPPSVGGTRNGFE